MRSPRVLFLANAAVAAVLLILVTLAGCGSGMNTYTDSTYDYSVSYPATWSAQPGGTSDASAGSAPAGTVTIYDPQGTTVDGLFMDLAMVMVYRLNFTVTDPWAQNVKTQMEGLVTSCRGSLST